MLGWWLCCGYWWVWCRLLFGFEVSFWCLLLLYLTVVVSGLLFVVVLCGLIWLRFEVRVLASWSFRPLVPGL